MSDMQLRKQYYLQLSELLGKTLLGYTKRKDDKKV